MSASYLVSASATSTKHRLTSLSWSSATALTIRLSGAAGLFLSHVVLVRSLGVTGFGEYAEAIAWLQVLCVVGKFGFDNASLRFISEYTTKEQHAKREGFRRFSARISFTACIAAMLLIVIATIVCWNSIGARLACCLLIASSMIPLISYRQIQEASLRGLGRLVESQISTVIWPMMLFILAALFWAISPTELSSPVAMFLHLASVATVSALVYQFVLRERLSEDVSAPDQTDHRQWINTAIVFLLAELLIGLKSRICIVMAARLISSEAAGLYAAMDRFAEVSVLGSQSLGFVIAPQFASLFATGRYPEMRKLMRQGSILSLVSTLPVAVGILCCSDLIFLLLGSSYRQGWYLLLTLLISMCFSVLSGPAAYVLQMSGRERSVLAITGICAATNILFGLLLVGPLGIEGLGISQIMTSLVWTIGIRLCLWQHPAWKENRDDPSLFTHLNEEIEAAR